MRSFLLIFLLAAAAGAAPAVPANGLDEPPRRGMYAETALGVFTAFGGSVGASNAQPYIGMTFGRQLGSTATVFGSLGIGAASATCFQLDAKTGNCLAADSFGAFFVEAGA